ncbi:uncharacterized protein LOC134985626 [Pseudophryne corroboree]|uniref:uncharacterized protein LOC134985626 n=1 Tax=Pseudophryne corroboree TaxID=495146 RepID=UPI003081D452
MSTDLVHLFSAVPAVVSTPDGGEEGASEVPRNVEVTPVDESAAPVRDVTDSVVLGASRTVSVVPAAAGAPEVVTSSGSVVPVSVEVVPSAGGVALPLEVVVSAVPGTSGVAVPVVVSTASEVPVHVEVAPVDESAAPVREVTDSVVLGASRTSSVASATRYYLVNQSLTWLEASFYCRSHYTGLASTLSDQELLSVIAVVTKNEAWIGLYLSPLGIWRWSNGATGTYTMWNSGEPSQNTNACVRISSGKWSDANCGSRYYFVCYKSSSTTVPSLPSNCQWQEKCTTTTPATYRTTTRRTWSSSTATTGHIGSITTQGATNSSVGAVSGHIGSITTQGATNSSVGAVSGHIGSITTQGATNSSVGAVSGHIGSITTQGATNSSVGVLSGHIGSITTQGATNSSIGVLSGHIGSITTQGATNSSVGVLSGHIGSITTQGATNSSVGAVSGHIGSITTQGVTNSSVGVLSDHIGSITTQGATNSSVGVLSGHLHLVQTPMTWSESRTYCRSYFTDLAATPSPDEQHIMSAMLASVTPSKGFWFGLKRSRFWGNWYWSGGQIWGKFTFWGDAEPNNPLSKQCGLITGDPARNFSWSSECCGQPLPFVCYGG